MKSWKCRAVATVYVAILLILGGRLIWAASRAETAWSLLAVAWRDATLGWFSGAYVPLPDREPEEQTDFWLPEIERIVAAEPDNAELAAGAAWVLNSPGLGFLNRYLQEDKSAPVIPGLPPVRLDQDAIGRAEDRFEARCGAKCLELAGRACDLEPEDVRWWQTRALLAHRYGLFGSAEPRCPDEIEILEECARHDPDNALYDYLAAWSLWDKSVYHDFLPTGEVTVRVLDPKRAERAAALFERGQKRKSLELGDSILRVVLATLRRAHVSAADRLKVVESRPLRITWTVARLARHQMRYADAYTSAGNHAAALASLRKNERLFEQIDRGGEGLASHAVVLTLREGNAQMLCQLAKDHPELFSADERKRIEEQRRAAERRVAIVPAAAAKLPHNRRPDAWSLTFGLAVHVLPATLSLLAVAAAAGVLAARLLAGRRAGAGGALGWLRHAITWIAAYALTFTVFGLMPADIIPVSVQGWLFAGLAALLAVGACTWLAGKLCRLTHGGRLQFGLRALFGVTLGLAVILSALKILGVDLAHPDLHLVPRVAARGWSGIAPEALKWFATMAGPSSFWAAIQWLAYGGIWAGPATALGLIALWHRARSPRNRPGATAGTGPSRRGHWADLLRTLARSAAVAAACLLLAYFALAPSSISLVEDDYQRKIAYYLNPQEHWGRLRQAIAEAEAGPMPRSRADAARDAAEEE